MTRHSAALATARRESSWRRAQVAQWAFLVPALVYIVAFFGYPIVKNVVMGFQDFTARSFYTGEAPFVGVENYDTVIHSQVFTKALANTFLFTLGSLAGQFVIGMALAVFFAKHFPLAGTLRAILLVPWLLPLIVTSAAWRLILDLDSGVLNKVIQALGGDAVPWLTSPNVALVAVILVNVWVGIPFNTVLLYGGLQDIPTEYYEAAALDGASGLRRFRSITWPLLRPVVTVVLVLGVVYTLRVLDIILGLTGGGPANASQTLATVSYQMSFGKYEFGQGAATANILILISLAFAVLYLRASRTAANE